MKKEITNIEDLFRQSFDGYKIEPPDKLWGKLNSKLDLKQFFRADFGKFNIYYTCLIVGLVTTVSILLFNNKTENQESTNKIEIKTENTKANDKIVTYQNEKKLAYDINNTQQNNNIKFYKNSIPIASIPIDYIVEEGGSNSSPNQIQKKDQKLFIETDTSNNIESLIPNRPKVLFTIKSNEGCAPFELKLNNLTLDASNYYWSFGDGGNSKDKSPLYTYNYPGVYRIQLKATGAGGTAISIIDSIIVHDKPEIKFIPPYQTELMVGEKIIVPVEAQNAKRFEWDFGDGTLIRKKQADYSYKSAGKYSINLKSWSESGCMDSVKIADISVVTNNDQIVFPNAFCPNPNGPSTGKYSENEIYSDIFHPKTNARISEYKLVIYSKTGAQIFQSNEIGIGWDGYFENRMMPEGVYPFIAVGKFEGGKPFMNKGNITIIHRK